MKKLNRGSLLAAVTVSIMLTAPALSALAASPSAVNLGSAGTFVVLTKTGISSTGATAVVGDIGVSPAPASYVTGFALQLPAAGAFSTSALVTGKIYAADYASPTPTILTTAVLDMQAAYSDAAGRAPTVTELGAGNIGGLTLAPGVYKWGTGVTIPTDVTLSGSANDVWIFQIAQTLTVSSGVHVNLSGGAQASNVFWVVAGQSTIGTTAVFNGTILDQTAVVLNTGAKLTGRALAQTAVTLDSNVVTLSSSAQTPAPTPTPVPAPTPIQPTQSQTPASTSSSTGSSQSGSGSTAVSTQGLNAQQQVQYNQLVSAGAAPALALNAVTQASAQTQTQTSSPVSAPINNQAIRNIAGNLVQGSQGSDVAILQQFLIAQNVGSAAQALARVGATAYFGSLTRAALAKFQASVGIQPALGNFGVITRAYVSTH